MILTREKNFKSNSNSTIHEGGVKPNCTTQHLNIKFYFKTKLGESARTGDLVLRLHTGETCDKNTELTRPDTTLDLTQG